MKYVRFNLLAAVLLAAVTMLLSEITQNQLATICGLMGYLLIDLFADEIRGHRIRSHTPEWSRRRRNHIKIEKGVRRQAA